jgi:hypothetical protein
MVLWLFAAGAASAQACPGAEEVRDRLQLAHVEDVFVIGEDSYGGQVLMRLAAFAAAPKMIDQQSLSRTRPHAETLALDLLPPNSEVRARYLVNGRFAGATDAERAATRAAFFEACAATIAALAPLVPFRVAIADADMLGFFDAGRGVLPIPAAPDHTEPFILTEFLLPDRSLRYEETETHWPMTEADADSLIARLEAAAEVPSAARKVQAVTIVEVTRIDPETRATELRVVDRALYSGDFAERLYSYGGAAPQADPPPAQGTSGGAAAPDQAYASAEEAGAHALALCEASIQTATKLKCGCVAERVADRWAQRPDVHIYTHLNAVVADSEVECANPEGAHAASLDQCRQLWPSPYLSPEAAALLGVAKFCHCYADRVPSLGPGRAAMSCAEIVDYEVPEGSPLLE